MLCAGVVAGTRFITLKMATTEHWHNLAQTWHVSHR